MPNKFQQLALLLTGVVIITAAFFFQTSQPKPLADDQTPIDPIALTGEFDPDDTLGEFHGTTLAANEVPEPQMTTQVLGDSDAEKRIEVDLAQQMLYAYEGDKLVYNFLVSSGKWGRTPTGTFEIWGKFRYTKMEGGSKAKNTYYYLPNVPYVMFFSNDEVAPGRGFSIHGTYWHNNFGTPMSHGCINMKTEEVALLYEWAEPDIGEARSGRSSDDNPGTQVIIFGEAPWE